MTVLRADRYDTDDARGLASALHLSPPVAAVLARRGYRDPAAAARFLEAGERHDPDRFEGMERAVATILKAIRERQQITVYGDFDADGVCSTALAVAAVRECGGTCDWFIPDRIADGYGLSPEAVEALAARGTRCLVTVDCGVTAAPEVALATRLGLEVVVTDHHQFDPADLPDCPILHPELCRYPFPQLCGAGVAAKLAQALRRTAGLEAGEERDLDLVALATVADVMPLTGENRRLVREGMAVARRARRPGMQALIEECRIVPAELAAEDLGFRLAPRINAAGRVARADAGVELFLTDSRDRAAEIADELGRANLERRRIEREVLAQAERQLTSQGDPGAAIVVAGEDWHPGVIGIVASRLVRAHGLPSVVISLDGERGRGSGRSVPGLDLHDTLGQLADHLLGFGGHAAAAGLTIDPAGVEPFRAGFEAAVRSRIGAEPVASELRFDAVSGGGEVSLELAEELERLGPFGNGNPPVSLLIPAAGISDLAEMGEGKHCRFTVVSGGSRAAGVCFGRNRIGGEADERLDLVAELRVNRWNGSIRPQLVVREALPTPAADRLAECGEAEWWQRFERALDPAGEAPADTGDPGSGAALIPPDGELPGGPPAVRVGEAVSAGGSVAIVTADAPRRWRTLGGSRGLGRFNPDARVAGLWEGSPAGELPRAGKADVLMIDYRTLGCSGPGPLDPFREVLLLDPPGSRSELALATSGPGGSRLLARADEYDFAARAAAHRFDLTGELRSLYRALRAGAGDDGGEPAGGTLRMLLAGGPEYPRSPERAGLLVRVLLECGLAAGSGEGPGRSLGVVSSGQVELTESAAFRTCAARHKETVEFLRRSQSAN